MKKIIINTLLFLFVSTLQAQNLSSNFNGVSATAGNLKPEGETYGIALQNEIIHLRRLDTAVYYDILYEFKNTGSSYGNITVTQPITLYFNEFRPGLRSNVLDKLAILFPDLFKVQDTSIDIRKQLKEIFGERYFVRRYVSLKNLQALGIVADIFRNNQRSQYKKILVEFKWEDKDPYNLERDEEVLVMEVKFTTDFPFAPNEQFNLLSFMKLPSTLCGEVSKQIYTAYKLGHDAVWEGTIKNMYIVYDALASTPVLPLRYSYQSKYIGEKTEILVLNNITPASNDYIAFYTAEEAACTNNNLFPEKLIVPSAIKNINASSWAKDDAKLSGRKYNKSYIAATCDSIYPYQTGNPTNLDLFSLNFSGKEYPSGALNTLVAGTCKNETAEIILKESGHPVYAFDLSNFDESNDAYVGKPNLHLQTSWCEGSPGSGEGEYIEFELLQPVSSIKIYNGNQMNTTAFDIHGKANIIRFHSDEGKLPGGEKDKSFSIIDLNIQNLYVMYLPAGTYRIYLDDVDAGKSGGTCISSILFHFEMNDEWFVKSFDLLQNAYKKQTK
jgi:hypothetical protein